MLRFCGRFMAPNGGYGLLFSVSTAQCFHSGLAKRLLYRTAMIHPVHKKLIIKEHPHTLRIMTSLAITYRTLGDAKIYLGC
jgi:hypothetical protein